MNEEKGRRKTFCEMDDFCKHELMKPCLIRSLSSNMITVIHLIAGTR